MIRSVASPQVFDRVMKAQPKAQTIARELALLTLSQLSKAQKKLAHEQPRELQLTLEDMMLKAIGTLQEETQEALEAATAELQRANDRLLNSQTRASELEGARLMTQDAIELTEAAINRLGYALKMPEYINNFNRTDVRNYALSLLVKTAEESVEIDSLLSESIVDWQLGRLPKLDRDILRLAVAEIAYLGLEERIAINEAVELANRYSDDQGRKFINGVLRRVTEQIKAKV
jgi:transcription antitermination protein NusB